MLLVLLHWGGGCLAGILLGLLVRGEPNGCILGFVEEAGQRVLLALLGAATAIAPGTW